MNLLLQNRFQICIVGRFFHDVISVFSIDNFETWKKDEKNINDKCTLLAFTTLLRFVIHSTNTRAYTLCIKENPHSKRKFATKKNEIK